MGWIFTRKEEDVERKLGLMNANLSTSFANLKRDISTIKEWIEHFKAKETENETRFRRIEDALVELKDDVLILKEAGLHSKVQSFERPEWEIERSNRTIERVQSFNRSDQTFMNVQSVDILSRLTPAQKNVILLLLNAGGPLGYEDIGKKLGLNVVTIRRHINDILRAGIPLNLKVSVNNRRKMVCVSEDLKVAILPGRKKAKGEK